MEYFETLKTDYRHDYLTKQPTKSGAIDNAAIIGRVRILDGSNNRALTIETPDGVYLQSYGTIILKVQGDKIKKFWNGYSATTMKHINTFLNIYGLPGFSKKTWLNFQS